LFSVDIFTYLSLFRVTNPGESESPDKYKQRKEYAIRAEHAYASE